jgi:hypothetical protein
MSIEPALQNILTGILHTEEEDKKRETMGKNKSTR